ncbi:MAG: hypothetical protein JO142_01140 [Burkholderiales bacterium]|nr:hypothetical protein [Burkholderiales bacterium]
MITLQSYLNRLVYKAVSRFIEEIPNGFTMPWRPLEMAVLFATDDIANSILSDSHEEPITAAFITRIETHLTWCWRFIASDDLMDGHNKESRHKIGWAEYNKCVTSEAGEPKKGADFALVIPFAGSQVRVAIFQAKKCGMGKVASDEIRIDHSNSLGSQASILRATVDEISEAVSGLSHSHAPFAHYIAWPHEKGTSAKVIDLQSVLVELLEKKKSSIKVNDAQCMENAWVLLQRGLSYDPPLPASDGKLPKVDGWLSMTYAEAKQWLPKIMEIAPVIIADDSGSSGGLVAELAQQGIRPDRVVDCDPDYALSLDQVIEVRSEPAISNDHDLPTP